LQLRPILFYTIHLRRMYIIQYADDLYAKSSLMDEIRFLFAGNAEAIYSLLSSYAIENDLLGREITAYMLLNYLTVLTQNKLILEK
jgi:hypothetical protein